MPPPHPHKMISAAGSFLSCALALTRKCLRLVGNNRAQASVRRNSRIGKAGKKLLTSITVRDVINREHKLMCLHGQKKSQYVREGVLQHDLVYQIVVACPRFQYTRSRANTWCSVYLYTTYGGVHTITCKYPEAQSLGAFRRFNGLRA
jgi:hypothetical protein